MLTRVSHNPKSATRVAEQDEKFPDCIKWDTNDSLSSWSTYSQPGDLESEFDERRSGEMNSLSTGSAASRIRNLIVDVGPRIVENG